MATIIPIITHLSLVIHVCYDYGHYVGLTLIIRTL